MGVPRELSGFPVIHTEGNLQQMVLLRWDAITGYQLVADPARWDSYAMGTYLHLRLE